MCGCVCVCVCVCVYVCVNGFKLRMHMYGVLCAVCECVSVF